MTKLSASEDCITLRTFTKNYYSPKGFILTQKELLELEEKSHLTVSDIRFFAELALRKGIEQEEILETVFTWLSLEEESRVKVTFQSGRNLKAVAETKALRKKLGKFMADHFQRWKGSRQITVYDDFEPYSFFFQEQTPYGAGMCGGVILHGRENLEKTYYGISVRTYIFWR